MPHPYTTEPHFNLLSAAEDERLAILIEECAEVIQIATKIQRHGYESINPILDNSPTNRRMLEKEIGHLLNSIAMMRRVSDINGERIAHYEAEKRENIRKYLHHQPAEDQ